jgi:hypothetical protein
MLDNGTTKRAMIRNDGKAIFGTDTTLANNIRLHHAGQGYLQFVTGDDTTAENTVSTKLAQVGHRFPNFATTALPAIGSIGRVVFDTTTQTLKVDNGTAWSQLAQLTGTSYDILSFTSQSAAPSTPTAGMKLYSKSGAAYKLGSDGVESLMVAVSNVTKGDLIAFNGTTNVRVPVGTNGQYLTADSTNAAGVSWQTSSTAQCEAWYGLTTAYNPAANQAIKWDTKIVDTNNAYSPSTGGFLVPAGFGGTYRITVVGQTNALFSYYVRVDAVYANYICSAPANTQMVSGSVKVKANAGQIITIYPDSNTYLYGKNATIGFPNMVFIERTGN